MRDDCRAVLDLIAAAAEPWVPLDVLAMVGWEGLVDELVGEGLVELWDRDAAGRTLVHSLVTLTPLAAERLGVCLIEPAEEAPRWTEVLRWDDRPETDRLPEPAYARLPRWRGRVPLDAVDVQTRRRRPDRRRKGRPRRED